MKRLLVKVLGMKRLRLFLIICGVLVVAYFLFYFILDMALSLRLSSLERQYREDFSTWEGGRPGDKISSSGADTSLDIRLEVEAAGIDLAEPGCVEREGAIISFFQMNHRALESILERPDDSIVFPEQSHVNDMESLNGYAKAIREELMRAEGPFWTGNRKKDQNLLRINQIGEWLAAEALRFSSLGDQMEAALYAEALRRLSLSLLEAPRNQNCWITAAALGQTHAGVLRKIGPRCSGGMSEPSISPYVEALRGTILAQSERLIRGAREMENIGHLKVFPNEMLVWRTYGRLWFRYSLIKEAVSRHKDFNASSGYLSCDKIRQGEVPVMRKSFWMINEAEFRTEDMKFRLQKLAITFEFTGWILSGKKSLPVDGLLGCGRIKTIIREERGRTMIAYSAPYDANRRKGVIDLPDSFVFPQ